MMGTVPVAGAVFYQALHPYHTRPSFRIFQPHYEREHTQWGQNEVTFTSLN